MSTTRDDGADARADVDWEAIEASQEFRDLVANRRRFVVAALSVAVVATVVFVLLANLAPGVMGASVAGDFTFGFAYGVLLIFLTWAITLLYLRKSDREWGPLERRAAELASRRAGTTGPSTREGEPVR
jgi:uncharacterized membrane protein (DUF485 family)